MIKVSIRCLRNSSVGNKIFFFVATHSNLNFVPFHLFLVPFEVWEENKTNVWVWIFINDPLCLGLLLQDVVYPLFGAESDT